MVEGDGDVVGLILIEDLGTELTLVSVVNGYRHGKIWCDKCVVNKNTGILSYKALIRISLTSMTWKNVVIYTLTISK